MLRFTPLFKQPLDFQNTLVIISMEKCSKFNQIQYETRESSQGCEVGSTHKSEIETTNTGSEKAAFDSKGHPIYTK